jgi:transposase
MRYELSDNEWGIIRAMLPTKPRGIPRVDDRRVLNGIFWVLRSGALAGSPNHLWTPHHLLQSVRSLAKGRHLGQDPAGADTRT